LPIRSEEEIMTVDEPARLRLYEKARTSWGDDAADTLMSSLPSDVSQLVTKDYLDAKLDALEGRLEARLTRMMLVTVLGGNATLVGLVFAAIKLAS
jgi:hypothetical protein